MAQLYVFKAENGETHYAVSYANDTKGKEFGSNEEKARAFLERAQKWDD